MIKLNCILSVLIFHLYSLPSSVQAGDFVNDFPSQLFSKARIERPSVTALLNENDDLRTIFVTRESLQLRIAESAAVLDFGDKAHAQEYKVSAGTKVQDFLNQTFIAGWKGNNQLRLIKQHEIYQTPLLSSDRFQEEIKKFLNREVSAGDLLVRIASS